MGINKLKNIHMIPGARIIVYAFHLYKADVD